MRKLPLVVVVVVVVEAAAAAADAPSNDLQLVLGSPNPIAGSQPQQTRREAFVAVDLA